jgi:Protein tyrosine and serine/threonine kinase
MPSVPSSLRNRGQEAAEPSRLAQPKNIASDDYNHLNFYSFLSAAQQHGVEFMPITWEPARDLLGLGASGYVNQSLIDIETSLAFKRPAGFGRDERATQEIFRAWLMEISILRSPEIERHPNIIELEGIAWEVVDSGSSILPVLVYRKSHLGTLRAFLDANFGSLSINQKLRLCFDLASALSTLHSLSKWQLYKARPLVPH